MCRLDSIAVDIKDTTAKQILFQHIDLTVHLRGTIPENTQGPRTQYLLAASPQLGRVEFDPPASSSLVTELIAEST